MILLDPSLDDCRRVIGDGCIGRWNGTASEYHVADPIDLSLVWEVWMGTSGEEGFTSDRNTCNRDIG